MKKYTFRGGIHPLQDMHEGKAATRDKPIRVFIPETVCIAMDMHIGAPSKPIVKKGDSVKLGQIIGEPVGGLGLPVHASVSGTVLEVAVRQQLCAGGSLCVVIQNDKTDEWSEGIAGLGGVEEADPSKIIEAVRNAGICGMGGASFPTHVKMTVPEGKQVDTIILNGAECETFLTADDRLMREEPGKIVDGLRASMRAMNVKQGIIAIEENKPEAIRAMKEAASGREGVAVAVLKTKYPQGGEKQLINAVLGRQVPSGGLPADAHVVVMNVGTAAAIRDAVVSGTPLISRVTTVTGCVREPSNLLLRIGTLFGDAIADCGGYSEEPGKIFAGGSMTGICAPNEGIGLIKGNNGIVVFSEKDAKIPIETDCIRCARCIGVCPIRLNPYRMRILCDQNDFKQAKAEHINDCILCGACSYICPAHRVLSPKFKDAKDLIRARRI